MQQKDLNYIIQWMCLPNVLPCVFAFLQRRHPHMYGKLSCIFNTSLKKLIWLLRMVFVLIHFSSPIVEPPTFLHGHSLCCCLWSPATWHHIDDIGSWKLTWSYVKSIHVIKLYYYTSYNSQYLHSVLYHSQ